MNFFAVKLAHNTFDVFEGNQWGHHVVLTPEGQEIEQNSSWSRLKGGRNGVYVAKGRSLPHALVRALAEAIDPREDKQLVVLN